MILLLALLAAAEPGHALIVTNNRSSTLGLPDLRYADDDGAQYAELFSELLGKDHVELLTTFDAESRRLFPEQVAQAPTFANLAAAIAHLVGARGDIYLILAGHGDVDDRGGFIELEDGKLTSTALDTLLGQLPNAQVHLILDSCNSYFMLNPRKPGGTRFRAEATDRSLLARHPRMGALLSTSAESVTYEWSELQSGIFSYLVRSGLRGGADANGDGRVTYQELAAFVQVATQSIPNDLYRPKLFMHGPSGDGQRAFASLTTANARHLQIDAEGERRLTIRDAMGVRLLDVRKQDGTALQLLLPAIGVFEITETLTTSTQTRAFAVASARLDDLPTEKSPVAFRGEAPIFQHLFERPFGSVAFAQASTLPTEEEAYGVSTADVMRLRAHLGTAAAVAQKSVRIAGIFELGMALGIAALGSDAVVTYPQNSFPAVMSGIVGGGLLIVGILSLTLPTPEENFFAELAREDLSSEKKRAEVFTRYEERWRLFAQDARRRRLISGIAFTGLGSLLLGLSLESFFVNHEDSSRLGATVGIADSGFALAFGISTLALKTAFEISWDAYQSEHGELPAKLHVVPVIGASATAKTRVFGLGGIF
jgi:hypothetical protein